MKTLKPSYHIPYVYFTPMCTAYLMDIHNIMDKVLLKLFNAFKTRFDV